MHFWTTTLALIEAESATAEDAAAGRYAASFKAHRPVRDGLSDGGLRYAMLSFSKSAGTKGACAAGALRGRSLLLTAIARRSCRV